MHDTSCGLCGRPTANASRLSGLDLCFRCFEGDAAAQASDRGYTLQVRVWTRGEGTRNERHHCSVDAHMGKPLFAAHFGPNTWLNQATSWVRGRITVADPLFHRVCVPSSRDVRAQRFLDDEAGQSSVMDLVGEQLWVVVQPDGRMRAGGSRPFDPFDEITVARSAAVLLVHLETFALVHGA